MGLGLIWAGVSEDLIPMVSRTGGVWYEVWKAAALVSWFGSLGAEATGAVARETRCTLWATWTSKCLIPACKRQTGFWWRRYRGIEVTVVLGPVLTYACTLLSQAAYDYLTVLSPVLVDKLRLIYSSKGADSWKNRCLNEGRKLSAGASA